jgi:hypothetical protein
VPDCLVDPTPSPARWSTRSRTRMWCTSPRTGERKPTSWRAVCGWRVGPQHSRLYPPHECTRVPRFKRPRWSYFRHVILHATRREERASRHGEGWTVHSCRAVHAPSSGACGGSPTPQRSSTAQYYTARSPGEPRSSARIQPRRPSSAAKAWILDPPLCSTGYDRRGGTR